MTTNYRTDTKNTRNNRIETTKNNSTSYPESLVISELHKKMTEEANLVCLRNKHTGRIENVSYTEAGLTWTFDKLGRPIYYKYPNTVYTSSGYMSASFRGTFEKNPDMVVEQFIPINHIDADGRMNFSLQKAEVTFVSKALRLMAPMNTDKGEEVESITDMRARISADIEKVAETSVESL